MKLQKCTLQIETEYYTDENNVYIILPKFEENKEIKILEIKSYSPTLLESKE